MGKHIANIITSTRILCSIVLLWIPVFSPAFYFLYCFCGFTDMIDGAIARKTNSVTAFGSRLDSIADFVFVVIVFVKLLPVLTIPNGIWYLIIVIAVIKFINLISGFIYSGEIRFEHTVMNKITGLLLFLLPLTLSFIELDYSAPIVCIVALISAIQEGYFIRSKYR